MIMKMMKMFDQRVVKLSCEFDRCKQLYKCEADFVIYYTSHLEQLKFDECSYVANYKSNVKNNIKYKLKSKTQKT